MILIVNINVLPYFENRNNADELHNIFEETGSKLRRWSQLGLLRSCHNPLCFLIYVYGNRPEEPPPECSSHP
jgi:hypothetical protein